MATNHTANYNLNLWEANDKFVRDEFNQDNAKIDAALKAEADARAAADTAINTVLAGAVKFSAGTYTGDGTEDRIIPLDFTPKAVLVLDQQGDTGTGRSGGVIMGGLAVATSPLVFGPNTAVETVSGGFRVKYLSGDTPYTTLTNTKNKVYHYIALA